MGRTDLLTRLCEAGLPCPDHFTLQRCIEELVTSGLVEQELAAEVIAAETDGHAPEFDNRAIPAVVFTDPEIAW